MIAIEHKILNNLNASNILQIIYKEKQISRADLAKRTSLTRAGITKLTKKLLDGGFVKETGVLESSGGRPAKILEIKEDFGNIITLNLAPNYIEAILYNTKLEILSKEKLVLWIKTRDLLLESIIKITNKLVAFSHNEIIGIGLAVNGLVDSEKGISIFSPHYKWKNVNLKEIMEKEFHTNIYVENDVKAMAMGEKYYGITQESQNFILVNIEHGVGSALYINDRILNGNSNGAGEFGHLPIESNNKYCKCGKKGCLETLINNENIEENYLNIFNEKLSAQEIYINFKNNKSESFSIVKDAVKNLAIGLTPIINIINPQCLVINGDITLGGPAIYDMLKKELHSRTFVNLSDNLLIEPSILSGNGASIGVARTILNNYIGL